VTNDPVPAAIIPALVNHPAAEINPPNNLEEGNIYLNLLY